MYRWNSAHVWLGFLRMRHAQTAYKFWPAIEFCDTSFSTIYKCLPILLIVHGCSSSTSSNRSTYLISLDAMPPVIILRQNRNFYFLKNLKTALRTSKQATICTQLRPRKQSPVWETRMTYRVATVFLLSFWLVFNYSCFPLTAIVKLTEASYILPSYTKVQIRHRSISRRGRWRTITRADIQSEIQWH